MKTEKRAAEPGELIVIKNPRLTKLALGDIRKVLKKFADGNVHVNYEDSPNGKVCVWGDEYEVIVGEETEE